MCVVFEWELRAGVKRTPPTHPPLPPPPRRVTFALGLICILAPCAGMLLLLLLLLLAASCSFFLNLQSFSLFQQLVSFLPPFSYSGCRLHPHTHPLLPFFSFWPCPLFSLPHHPVSLPLFVSFVNFSLVSFAPFIADWNP